ncbi:MAG: hypothetical protein ACTHMS_10650 [Jatrophihabitans sp.]|uniref:hypothetical protein n=1 Tax=Jatrophihabitans sp. TaxID=1932789 RepID=UPI003F7FB0C5
MSPTVVLAVNNEPLKSGPIGLGIILILCVVCFFLFRSMSRHMRNVRESFPGETRDAHGRPVTPAAADVAPTVETPGSPVAAPPASTATRPPRAPPTS